MLVVGADENGLGPQLGPLISTAVACRLERYEPEPWRRLGGTLGLADSKVTSAFGKMAHAEGVVLALLDELHGEPPADLDALLELLSLDGGLALRAGCPGGETTRQCFGSTIELPRFGGQLEDGRARLRRLADEGMQLVRARTVLSCAGDLNRRLEAGQNKLSVDLEAFERLLEDMAMALGAPLNAICGQVGGIRRYLEHFRRFGARGARERSAEPGQRRYEVEGVGEVIFEIDADATHLPVALASMVGKYVRELSMDRLMTYYGQADASLPRVSGYHDPRTRRFVEQSARARRRLGIVEGCFLRRR